MGEHHRAGVPAAAHLDDGGDPVRRTENGIDAEAVHAEQEAHVGQLL